jgi:hypothetical protein
LLWQMKAKAKAKVEAKVEAEVKAVEAGRRRSL